MAAAEVAEDAAPVLLLALALLDGEVNKRDRKELMVWGSLSRGRFDCINNKGLLLI